MAHHGVRAIALEWFRNYLTNRRQYVQINGKISNTETVTYGVPQGSVLRPLLFIIYTNDLSQCLTNSKGLVIC